MPEPTRVLVAEGNGVHRHFVQQALDDSPYELTVVGTWAEATARGPADFDAALVSEQLEDREGLDVVRELAVDAAGPPSVLLVAPGSPIEPAEAVRAGAVDLVIKSPQMGGALRLALVRALQRQQLRSTIADLERRLAEHTRVDAISGLYTQHYFRELLAREISRLRRFGGTMALLAIPYHTAEGIERTLGSHVRDRVLHEIGQILRADLRITDVAGRFDDGGFLIALPGTDEVGARRVSERLRARFAELEDALDVGADLVPEPELLAVGGADQVAAALS